MLRPVLRGIGAHGGGPFRGEEGGLRGVGLGFTVSSSSGAVGSAGDFGRVCCALTDGGCEGEGRQCEHAQGQCEEGKGCHRGLSCGFTVNAEGRRRWMDEDEDVERGEVSQEFLEIQGSRGR